MTTDYTDFHGYFVCCDCLLLLTAAIFRKICCARSRCSLLRLTLCRLLENKFMQCIDIAPARHSSSKLGSALAHSQCSQTSGLMSSDDPNGRAQHLKLLPHKIAPSLTSHKINNLQPLSPIAFHVLSREPAPHLENCFNGLCISVFKFPAAFNITSLRLYDRSLNNNSFFF